MMKNMRKTHLQSLKLVALTSLFLVSTNIIAATCPDVFPTVLSSSANNGKVDIAEEVVLNGTNGSLDIQIGNDKTNNSSPSCISQKCTDLKNRAEAFTLPSFQTSSSSQVYTITSGQTLSLAQGSYDKIQLEYQSTVRFTQNSTVTYIEDLKANNTETTVIFEEGIYWIDDFDTGYRTNIVINGNDKVTLIVNTSNFHQSEASFNVNGTPDQLVLITYDNVKFGYKANFNGFIYADAKLEIRDQSVFEGAINRDDIELRYRVEVIYAPDSLGSANFNGFCTVSPTSGLSGNLAVDNFFTAYISTDDSVQGDFLSSGNRWETTYTLLSQLTPGQDYYLHIKATNRGGPAGLLGDFEITGTEHTFSNGLTTLKTNTTDWAVSTSGWNNYQTPTSYGTTGSAPWSVRHNIDASAEWIWSSNNQTKNTTYFSTHIIVPPITPLIEYRFEELSWDGSSGEVIDNTGNGYNAQVISNSVPETASPALTGNPGTCGYASQNNGSIRVTGLPLDTTTEGVKTTVTFWMNWDGTNNIMPIGWDKHNIWIRDGNIGFNTDANDIYGMSSDGLANRWLHIAVEFTNGSVTSNRIHIDGEEQVLTQRRGSPRNATAYVHAQMRVGGWSKHSGYTFNGQLDEFRVYETALSTSQVETIMAETHACAEPAVHHYEIIHDGQGLTCDAETVTIKACADASCSTLSAQPVTLDFLADGAVKSSPTFTGSNTVTFNNTDVETVTLSLTNTSITASNALVCKEPNGNSCDIEFTDAGFRFLSGAGNSTTLPNQTSGAVFGDSLKIQAVQDTDGVCTGLFSGNKNVDLSQQNVQPGGTSGLNFTIDGNTVAKHSSTTNTTLNFGADSIAIIPTPIYHDAGQIRLHANYNAGGVALTGTSNSFWVSPAELVVSAKSGLTNLDGATATATTTYAAGENFDLTVTAYNAATPAVITPNYSPGQIQLMLTRTGPTLTDSVNGNLSYRVASTMATSASPAFQDVTLTSFSSGVSTYNAAQYSEVGLLNLDAQDSDYGNASIVIPAVAINIGRFVPERFAQTVADDGYFIATCNASTAYAAYSGQMDEASNSMGAISYLSNPILAITAYNKQGNITQNYYQDSQGSSNDYMKLSASNINLTTPTFDEIAVGVDNNKLPLTATMNTGTLSQTNLTALSSGAALPRGVLHYQLSAADHFFYNRSANALVAPFTSDIDFSVATITDSDNVGVTTTVDASPTGVEIRFGRLLLENSFGPETSNFPQPMQIEHFDGATFVATPDDNCAGYDAGKISLTHISLDPALTNALGGTGRFLSGKTQTIELQAPGAGNQGQIGVSYDAYDWFKYDWANDGAYDNSPSAVATFGIFRGNDRTIHWREVFND
jgi:hypothetical protein